MEWFEFTVVGGLIGFGIGILTTRYLRKEEIQRKHVGEIIETGMIISTVKELNGMIVILRRLIIDIQRTADELADKVEVAQDLEKSEG